MTPSELAYRGNHTTMVASVSGTGFVDIAALEKSFAALRAEHPGLAGAVERTEDGYAFVLPAVPLPGVVRVRETDSARPPTGRDSVVDPATELSAVDLAVAPGEFCLSLLVSHSAYDGNTVVRMLLSRLLEQYAAVVSEGKPADIVPKPVPESYERLIGERGLRPTDRMSGLEEALRAAPIFPVVEVPGDKRPRQVRLSFTEDETTRLRAVGGARGASMSAVITGIVVAAFYALMGGQGELVVPVLSVVSIRDRLDPPVLAEEGTVMLGTGGSVVVATATSDPLELGKQVSGRLFQELRSGVIQESHLHIQRMFGELVFPPPDAGPVSKFVVGISNVGVVPDYPDPPGLVIEDFQGISANLTAGDFGKPERDVATRHIYWFMATTYKGRLSLAFKVRDAEAVPDHELALVRALRTAKDMILAE